MFNFYHNDFTQYLNSLYNDECKEFHIDGMGGTYFMYWEESNDFDKELCGKNDCKVACFRSAGYTVGHCICDSDDVILNIVCYDRGIINDFVVDYKKLNDMLNEQFIGKKLIITEN